MTTLCRRYNSNINCNPVQLERTQCPKYAKVPFPNTCVLKDIFLCPSSVLDCIQCHPKTRHDATELYTHTVLQPPQHSFSSFLLFPLPSPSLPFSFHPFLISLSFYFPFFFPFFPSPSALAWRKLFMVQFISPSFIYYTNKVTEKNF